MSNKEMRCLVDRIDSNRILIADYCNKAIFLVNSLQEECIKENIEMKASIASDLLLLLEKEGKELEKGINAIWSSVSEEKVQ